MRGRSFCRLGLVPGLDSGSTNVVLNDLRAARPARGLNMDEDLKSRFARGFLVGELMATRREQRLFALTFALLMFVGQLALMVVLYLLVPRPMSLFVDYLPIALGLSAVAGVGTWNRGRKLPPDHG
jgi:hypothetical protein